MRNECLQHQRSAVMGLGIHPWVWGMPSRIRYLRDLLSKLNQADGMAFTTPQTIYAQCASARDTGAALA